MAQAEKQSAYSKVSERERFSTPSKDVRMIFVIENGTGDYAPWEGHYFEGKKKGSIIHVCKEDQERFFGVKEIPYEDCRQIKWNGNNIRYE